MHKRNAQSRVMVVATLCAVSAGLVFSSIPGAVADPDGAGDHSSDHSVLTDADKAQIAQLEVELATVRSESDQARLNSQIATEEFNRARDELVSAEENVKTTQKAEAQANAEQESARKELIKLVLVLYRDRSLSLAALSPYLESDGLRNMELRKQAVEQFGAEADRKIQRFDAAEAVATVLHQQAERERKKRQDAVAAVSAERDKAAQVEREANARVAQLAQQRENLIVKLARARRVEVAQERERQERLEREAAERADAAARSRAEAVAAREARIVAERRRADAENRRPAPSQPAPRPQADKPTPNNNGTQDAARREAERRAAQEAARREAERQAAREAERRAAQEAARKEAEAAAARREAERQAARDAARQDADAPPARGAAGAVAWARNNLGIPYLWGGASSSGYDCSGFTQGAWGSQGVYLPHSSRRQYNSGTRIPLAKMKPGDLIFWSHNGSASGIFHVAIYVGSGMMAEAPYEGHNTTVTRVRYSRIMPYAVRVN